MKATLTINGKEIPVEIKDADVKKIEKAKTRPEEGDDYYAVGYALVEKLTWCNYNSDEQIWNSGNGFFTREEAEKELAKHHAIVRVKDYIIENGLEFTPDWGDFEEQKYSIWYDHAIKELNYDLSWFCQHERSFYFKSKKDALQVIEACSSDLKIIYGVKEEI